ncbi:MAG: MFS transporter [Lachnospiraceae bacterium]|nr:MFS transporter [Lachnospiraceae bacterium]
MSGKYRWWIVTGCLLAEALSLGTVNNCFSLYTIPVTQSLGISRAVFSAGQTLIFLSTMLMNTLVGGVIERLGILRTMRISAVVMSLSFFSYSLTASVWQFMTASAVIGLMMPMITAVPISLLIRAWFTDHVGLALGIAFMGSGLGGMVFNPVASFLIQNLGWRYAFGIIGCLMFFVLTSVTWFIIREPDTVPDQNRTCPNQKTGQDDLTGRPIREEYRTGLFWIMMLLAFCLGAGTYSIINFTSTYLQDTGQSATYAAGNASVSMGSMAVCKLFVGRMYDRFGVRLSTLICVAALTAGMLGFSFIHLPGAITAVLLGSAVGCPVGTVASPIISHYVFGDRDFARKVGVYTAFGNLGAAVTPVLSGRIYAMTGSYRMLYQMIAAVLMAAFVIYLIVFHNVGNSK